METLIRLSNGIELAFTSNSIFMEDSEGNSTFLEERTEVENELKDLEILLTDRLNKIKNKLIA